MFGLGAGKNTFVGIDVGTSAIKIAEIKISAGKPVLSNYAWMPLNKSIRGDGSFPDFETFIPDSIREIMKQSGIRGNNVYLSIPAFGGLISIIDFPKMAKEELEQAIRFEAHKYIPTPLEEVVLSWDVLKKEGEDSTLKSMSLGGNKSEEVMPEKKEAITSNEERDTVLLVAASKKVVEKYEKMTKKLGLNLKSIEIESFSIVRSLIGQDPGNFLIIDMGSRICNIMIIEKGIIVANRNIDAGGKDITNTIAKSMNIDEARAERLKVSGKNFFNTDPRINFPALETITAEVSRMLSTFYKDGNRPIFNSIILSGGTSGLAGINEYISKALGIKVVSGNPLGRVRYEEKLSDILQKIGPRFSVAVGLALKGVEDYSKGQYEQ